MPESASSAVILGTGAYTPETVVTNDALAARVDTSDEWIRTRTGIRERRFAAEGETTSDMAKIAAERAIAAAGIGTEAIDLILVSTMTPDMPFPSTACLLQSKLGLPQVAAFDIQAACSGFVYGLSITSSMLLSGRFRNALVVGAEKTSTILDFEDRSTCVLFGDGAGAAVLGLDPTPGIGILGCLEGADGTDPKLLYQPAGGSALPANEASVAARQHFLKMNGREIFKIAVRVMGDAGSRLLERHGYRAKDLDCIIPHQANMRIIDSLARRLGISMDTFHNNLAWSGNTSAASIPLALDEAVRSGRIDSGDLVLLVAFGAGLTWGSTLIKWQ